MLVQVVTMQVQPELLEPFKLEALNNCAASMLEADVVQFDLLQQSDDPYKFMLFEVYLSPDALEAHRLTPHFKRWVEVGVPMLTGERVRLIYQKLSPAP